jgi:hypothetical protein
VPPGEGIRGYPSYCPTGLQDPAYIGVATASLTTGHDPFVRIRVPQLTEEAVAQRAHQTSGPRADPYSCPTAVPATISA